MSVAHEIFNLLAEHINLHVQLADALNVLFSRHELHNSFSLQAL